VGGEKIVLLPQNFGSLSSQYSFASFSSFFFFFFPPHQSANAVVSQPWYFEIKGTLGNNSRRPNVYFSLSPRSLQKTRKTSGRKLFLDVFWIYRHSMFTGTRNILFYYVFFLYVFLNTFFYHEAAKQYYLSYNWLYLFRNGILNDNFSIFEKKTQ